MTYIRINALFKISLLSVLFISAICFLHSPTVSAASMCGVNTNRNEDFAGVMINIKIGKKPYATSTETYQEATGGKIRLKTAGATTTPPGGVINLNNYQHYDYVDFYQSSSTNCSFPNSSDNTNVVLGYGGSSWDDNGVGNNWAIDCDHSVRVNTGLNPYQTFDVSAQKLPDGVKSGGTWSAQIVYGPQNGEQEYSGVGLGGTIATIAPANGHTKYVSLIYHEPGINWQLSGSTQVSPGFTKANAKVSFYHTVSKVSGDPAYYTWRIQQNVNGAGWSDLATSGSGNNVNSSSPNNLKTTYQVPGGVGAGFTICQRIKYTDANGPFTGDGYSSAACSQVTADIPPVSAVCTTASIDLTSALAPVVFEIKDELGNVYVNPNSYYGPENPNANQHLWGGYVRPGLSATWNYYPRGNHIIVTQQNYQRVLNGNGNWTGAYAPAGNPVVRDNLCKAASCNINVWGDGPSNSIVSGGNIFITGTLSNPSPPLFAPYQDPSTGIFYQDVHYDLGDDSGNVPNGGVVAININGTAYPISSKVKVGNSGDIDKITLPAGPNASQITFSAYPSVYDGIALGNHCDKTVDVNKDLTISATPHAQYNNKEEPTSLNYYARIDNNNGTALPINAYACVIKYTGTYDCDASSFVPKLTTNNVANGQTYILGTNISGQNKAIPPPVTGGMRYCTLIYLEYTSAQLTPSGAVVNKSGGGIQKDCDTVQDKPFNKVFGGDISAGGNYLSSGSCTGGGIIGGYFNNTDGQPYGISYGRGASTDRSAIALGLIKGFGTAQTSPYRSPTELAFAGVASVPYDADSPTTGSSYGSTHCIDEVSAPATGATSVNGPYMLSASDMSIGIGENKAIYVNGDAFVPGNIAFPDGTWDKNSKTNSFILKATGNIYIDKNVTQLDGIYMAKNKIYTCAQAPIPTTFVPVPINSLYDNCNKQLVIHGSFVANKVNFMRTYGSLRDEKARTGASVSCSVAASGGRARVRIRIINGVCPPIGLTCSNAGATAPTLRQTCAAEVFEYTPEMYLSDPKVQKVNNGAIIYDAITSLPPVL